MFLVSTLAGLIGAPAAAAAAGGAAAASSFSFLQLATGIGTAFTALSTLGAGAAAAAEAKAAARREQFGAEDERIKGEFAAAAIRKQLALTLQRNQVAFAAAGIDTASGSAVAVNRQVARDAEQEFAIARINAERARLTRTAEARRLRKAGGLRLMTSLFEAGGIAAQGLTEAYQRG